MKIRMHRGGLEESMLTAEVIEPTKEAVCDYISRHSRIFARSNITFEEYSKTPDNRIGWGQTCLVLVNDRPVAMTDELVGIAGIGKAMS